MLGGRDQGGQEGGGPFSILIVCFHAHLPPGSHVAAASHAVPKLDDKEDVWPLCVIHRAVCSRRSQPSPMPSKWPKIQSPFSERTVNSAPSLRGWSKAGS